MDCTCKASSGYKEPMGGAEGLHCALKSPQSIDILPLRPRLDLYTEIRTFEAERVPSRQDVDTAVGARLRPLRGKSLGLEDRFDETRELMPGKAPRYMI
jgi:hypothetical protein